MAQFLSRADLSEVLNDLQGQYSVRVPVRRDGRLYFRRWEARRPGPQEPPEAVVGEVRTVEPLKAFFFRPREKVAEGYEDSVPRPAMRPLCLVGVKACDLAGLRILDRVFQDMTTGTPRTRAREKRV